ncbi:MAG TPA: hypothetical protein VFI42_04040 [Thermomicrobiaceae bacterium]|nr:hypothetical protein [Thermomicrobiaceae bacterium]
MSGQNSQSGQLPNVEQVVQQELSQMSFSGGISKTQLLDHFRMAPTVREMLNNSLPDTTFTAAAQVMKDIPQGSWQQVENIIEHGSPESHYLQSRAAHFSTWGKTPGFGHITEEEQANQQRNQSGS